MTPKCSICGREIRPGEKYIGTKVYVLEVRQEGVDFDVDAGPFVSVQCYEHAPGHILRASKGITTITGAARLGVQGVK
jgi:mevalonate pyrophosphate decarboxylase